MSSKFWSDYLKGRDYSKDLGVDGKMILEWILENSVGKCGQDASGLG
jgi:hypothetical protein